MTDAALAGALLVGGGLCGALPAAITLPARDAPVGMRLASFGLLAICGLLVCVGVGVALGVVGA
jgi:hypothetical protein